MDTFGTILEKIGQLFISSSGHTDADSKQQQERQENKKERRKERKRGNQIHKKNAASNPGTLESCGKWTENVKASWRDSRESGHHQSES